MGYRDRVEHCPGGRRGEIKVMNSATLSALCIRMLNMVGCLKMGSLGAGRF